MPISALAWAAASALTLFLPTAVVQGDRFSQAILELTGPLESVALEIPDRARTEYALALRAGERVERSVLTPAEPGARTPLLSAEGEGAARIVRWDDEAAQRRRDAWTSVPVALRMRPRVAALRIDGSGAPAGALLVVAAGFVATLAFRRKPRCALLVGVSSGFAAAAWTLAESAPRASIRVIEVDGTSGRSVAVDVARDVLVDVSADDLRWEATPEHAQLAVVASASGAVELRGEGVDLRVWRAWEPGARRLTHEVNEWGLLSPVWRRDAQGAWESSAAWRAGSPWGGAAGGTSGGTSGDAAGGRDEAAPAAPPGWIQPGLPMGLPIVLGRWVGADDSAANAREVWVRWIGP